MPKQHRGPRSEVPAHRPEERAQELIVDHGNQAAAEQIPSVADPARDHAALALRVVPRDPAWTERLVQIVERSGLSADQRELATFRLRGDQATADEVTSAVQRRLGRDDPALRAALIDALDSADADVAGLPAEAVEGLCRDLALFVGFVWDEEEQHAPAGDYLAEESGS